jgi:DNA-binding beta-propeller fold protein YncE
MAAKIGVISGLVLLAGCGNTYRPVVAAINPVGPAEQPQQFAVALATTGPNTPGVVNIEDVWGDTIVNLLSINNNPQFLALGFTGGAAYTLNGDGTVNYFSVNTTTLSSDVSAITLPAGANPNFLLSYGTFNYVTEPGLNVVGSLQAGAPPTLRQQLPVASNPVYIAGTPGRPRVYAISNGVTPGQVAAIETSTNTVSNTLSVGTNPVFGIMSSDGNRVFILNKGSGTVSVINAVTNQFDTFSDPVTQQSTNTIHDPNAAQPVWADLAPTLNELIVANAGPTPSSPGTLSIVSVPSCQTASASTNPNCDPNNPVDANGFGTVLANVPVGVNPVMVTVLQDGTQAYVANAGTSTIPGSITVVNLKTQTVVTTIPAAPDGTCNPAKPTSASPLTVCGHPTWIASTIGVPTGKVFVVSSDSTNMSVIRTDIDSMDTQIPLSGYGVSVRVTSP